MQGNQLQTFAACGAIAGVFARTDANRGVWTAPAGVGAKLVGVADLSTRVSDRENSVLNSHGINCLRVLPAAGPVVWGARTLRGADVLADDYKYIPVRRTALFIEESIYRGLQWAVCEPNVEALWVQIRLRITAFMHSLFQQGAFQGASPSEAYFVRCDAQTITQSDAISGVINILVGFAPLTPAEFVVLKLRLLTSQGSPS